MKVRFQTDANFDRRIVRATLRREPTIDLQLATAARSGAGLRGIPDAQVLAVAAQEGRMLLSHDHRTMPRHFGDFIAIQESPGVIIMPQRMLISVAVELIITIWAASEAEEWTNHILILPRQGNSVQRTSTTTASDAKRNRPMAAVVSTLIELDERGVAWITGTKVKVIEVATDKLAHGSSPEEMHVQYPYLSLAQMHAALAYYYEHQAEFEAKILRPAERAKAWADAAKDSPIRQRLREQGLLP